MIELKFKSLHRMAGTLNDVAIHTDTSSESSDDEEDTMLVYISYQNISQLLTNSLFIQELYV